MKVFSARRLTVARERRGITRKKLAETLGVSAPLITMYEDEQRDIKPPMDQRLAFALQFPIGFFYADDPDDIHVKAISFRSRRSMSAELRKKALASGEIATSIISPDFRSRFKYPVLDLPDFSDEEPEAAASLLRNHWKLGVGPIHNMIHLLESRGVEVFWLNEDSASVDAVSFWRDNLPFIVMNQHKGAGDRARFDGAHELAHLVLHRNKSVLEGDPFEQEADRFASAFLLPESQWRAEGLKLPIMRQYFPLKQRWGVSIQAMIRRSKDIGLLSEWQYECAIKELSSLGWRTKEPIDLPRETSQLQSLIFDSLQRKKITPKQIATSLNIDLYKDLIEIVPASAKYLDEVPVSVVKHREEPQTKLRLV